MKRRRSILSLPRILVSGLAVLLTLAAPLGAGEMKEQEAKKAPAAKQQPAKAPPVKSALDAAAHAARQQKQGALRVFTNEDLQRFGTAPAPAATVETTQPSSQPTLDPLQKMMADRAHAEERRRNLAEAQNELVAARNKVTQLEKRALSVKNPFLPRQAPGKEEAGDWSDLSGTERVARTEEELAQARENVKEALQRIARLRSGS